MGWPSAPLRREPDGLEFWLQGTMLKVAPVSTKYLSLVIRQSKKSSQRLQGKCTAVAVACVGKAAELKGGQNAPVSPIGVVIVKFTHVIARVLKLMKIWAGRRTTFGAAITTPFVAPLPAAGSGAPVLLC
jgi:hypothetical protein